MVVCLNYIILCKTLAHMMHRFALIHKAEYTEKLVEYTALIVCFNKNEKPSQLWQIH